ncbi:hypothetical protein L218DRAFT_906341 [Marasmius fiardii PR-910]|nr:hypothetical protein L218DRAFT_906341 [Marasmius fiardii PR-910]
MRLPTVFATISAILVTSVAAQGANIRNPASGFQVSAGQSFTVEVDTPPFLSSSVEVSVVLGYKPCGSMPCPPPADSGIGQVLYKGDYNPQFRDPHGLDRSQNFTVTIPTSASPGSAILSLVHYALIGALNIPWMESKAINMTVV